MKKIFTLTILACSCYIIQIHAQDSVEIINETKHDLYFHYSDKSNNEDKGTIDTTKVYTVVQEMPQFPEGDDALLEFVKENLQYPESAVKNGIQGRVVVRFVVSKDGSLKDIQVLRSLDAVCDKEAVRIIKSMPKWIPGKQNGKAVDVYYTLPVRFRFQDAALKSKN